MFNRVDATKLLKATFQKASTTGALCDATYDAITDKKPRAVARVGSGSLSYAFMGWAVPRFLVDWSIKRSPPKVYYNAALKVSTTSSATTHEE